MEEPIVIKNDELTYEEVLKLQFDGVVISPGPGKPGNKEDFGVCMECIKKLDKPILGVCLGFQGICEAFGGEIIHGERPMHGHISKISHNGKNLYRGVENDFDVTRYHSLIAKLKDNSVLKVDAVSEDGVIMGVHHKEKEIYGVQFHPESIMTPCGIDLIRNFKRIIEESKTEDVLYKKIDGNPDEIGFYNRLKEKYEFVEFLDGNRFEKGLSRFSIYAVGDVAYFYDVKKNEVLEKTGNTKKIIKGDIFSFIENKMKKTSYIEELPCNFQLGYVGYLGYELKNIGKEKQTHKSNLPDAGFIYADRAVIVDLKEKCTYLLAEKNREEFILECEEIINLPYKKKTYTKKSIPKMTLEVDRKEYIDSINKCKAYIKDGESYEICLTNKLIVSDAPDAVNYYRFLREKSPAPMSALLDFGEFKVASSSMETFLKIDKNKIASTKPIKGTARRGKTREEDERIKNSLGKDEKTLGENLMIADLLRNDLGKVSEIGSVSVPTLMKVETYKNLHQLVTTVNGRLKEDKTVIDALRALFPGGSMTGAPKERTMRIIDGLEKSARGIYSGAIGYISLNGCCDFNIVIRTAVIEKEKLVIGIGGAITYLSDAEEEFDEIMLKAKGNIRTMESYYDGGENIEMC